MYTKCNLSNAMKNLYMKLICNKTCVLFTFCDLFNSKSLNAIDLPLKSEIKVLFFLLFLIFMLNTGKDQIWVLKSLSKKAGW